MFARKVVTRDRAPRIDAQGVGVNRSRWVKCGEAVTSAHKAGGTTEIVVSSDSSTLVDAHRYDASRRPRSVKGFIGAVRISQKAVPPAAAVWKRFV